MPSEHSALTCAYCCREPRHELLKLGVAVHSLPELDELALLEVCGKCANGSHTRGGLQRREREREGQVREGEEGEGQKISSRGLWPPRT